ncbi:phospholipase A2 heteromtoxin-like [Venturia canescens]|uniref:phospholipase A2 heteromtoxin-like n=1 Tax=Venturia canescens TaxID=32260 RepID=UPI001C9C3525|nr:phospholipase A2 heteromtoxin-like [Venturia canescens]
MYVLSFTLAILCFLPGPIWSDTVVPDGQSSWCLVEKRDSSYPEPPAECCTTDYNCDVFINAASTKYGINNTSPWTQRLCSCEDDFRACLTQFLPRMDALKAAFVSLRQSCLKPVPCPDGEQCEKPYQSINYGHWIGSPF